MDENWCRIWIHTLAGGLLIGQERAKGVLLANRKLWSIDEVFAHTRVCHMKAVSILFYDKLKKCMLFDWYDNIIMHWETNGQMVEAFLFELNMNEKKFPLLSLFALKNWHTICICIKPSKLTNVYAE